MLLKKTATLLLILVFIPMMSLSVLANAQEYQTGDIITFGSYPQEGEYAEPLHWIVLDPATGLLLSQKVIDAKPYLNESTEDLESDENIEELNIFIRSEYKNSFIRDWLNHTFLTSAFSPEEQYFMQDSVIENDIYNDGYGTIARYTTTDKVFLLSVEEASNPSYGFKGVLEADPIRAAKGTGYAVRNGFNTGEGTGVEDWCSMWWLRNPSGLSVCICIVRGNGKIETVMASEDPLSTEIGIRPAMRIDLSSLGTTPDRAVGDPDGDKRTTSADARLALRASVKLETLGTWQKRAADADRDGVVSASDARTLLRASVGLETL